MEDKKEKILKMYYEDHLKQNEISKLIDVSTQYVSKVIKRDSRYLSEKDKRKTDNKAKRKEYLKQYFKTYRKENDNSNIDLISTHNKDVKKLSANNNIISNYAFAKWNISAYHTNSKGNLVIDKKLNITSDVPKIINRKITIPSQIMQYTL